MIANGTYTNPYLGAIISDIPAFSPEKVGLSEAKGAYVLSVMPDGPAFNAKLRSGLTAAALSNDVYVFGGEHPFDDGKPPKTFDDTEIYHPKTDTWTSGLPLPTARHGLTAGEVNGTIYVVAGGPEPGLSCSHANEILHA